MLLSSINPELSDQPNWGLAQVILFSYVLIRPDRLR